MLKIAPPYLYSFSRYLHSKFLGLSVGSKVLGSRFVHHANELSRILKIAEGVLVTYSYKAIPWHKIAERAPFRAVLFLDKFKKIDI